MNYFIRLNSRSLAAGLLLSLTVLLAWPGMISSARAETAAIGASEIHYDIPSGYVAAEEIIYAEVFKTLRAALPKELKIHALYVEKKVDERFRQSGTGTLDDYLMVVSLSQLADKNLTVKDFKGMIDFMLQNQGALITDEIRERAGQIMDEASGGAVKLGSVTPLGCFGVTETSISYMALMNQAMTRNGASISFEQAMVSTSMLVQGKIIMVNQYLLIDSPDQVPEFKDHSAQVLKEMNFPLGEAASGPGGPGESQASAAPAPAGNDQESGGNMTGIILGLVVLLALAGLLFYRVRKKSR